MIIERHVQGYKIVLDAELITPAHMLSYNLPNIVPFCLIQTKNKLNTWQNLSNLLPTEEELAHKEKVNRDLFLSLCSLIKTVNGEVLNYEELETAQLETLASILIEESTILFKKITSLDRNNLINLDIVSKRYGKLPSEVLGGDMTPLDDWMINTQVAHVALEEEYRNSQKNK